MSYLIPAAYTGMSSRDAHLRRNPPSGEPGTDYYMPTGTPLGAPARCRVVAIGGGIGPATGRLVLLDDGTRWLRALHLSEWLCQPGDELEPGETFALSGASGYGSEFFGEPYRNDAFWANTGGDHVHMTAFKGRAYTFGSSGTVDFHALTGGKIASGGAASAAPVTLERTKKVDLLVMLIEPVGGGLKRYLIDARLEAHREISSEKYNIYVNAGMPALAGVQPHTFLNEFPHTF